MKTVIFFVLASVAFAYPSSAPVASDPSYNVASDPTPVASDSTYNVASDPAPVAAAPAYETPAAAAPAYDTLASAPVNTYAAQSNDASSYNAPAAAAPVSSYGVVAAQPTIIPVPVYQAPTYNEPLYANTWRGDDFGRFEDVLSSRRRDYFGPQYNPYFFGKGYGFQGPAISNPFYDGNDRRFRKHHGEKKHRKHHWGSSSSSEDLIE